ncbi:glucosamine-6-phosphate isomerase [Thelonectria olida]|uniref:Glucosamine-6-phosphate isomerase n=1 Tax=Thelonectria olida TaxID=1576542 RepID=A0A9P9AHD1_9HYPO|nr:glucosamine-6-phosphate isomerase [Thelonectria olida]
MRLVVRDGPEAAASYISDYIIDRINIFRPTATKPFVLGLPTGSSPLSIYRNLVSAYRIGRVSFIHVVTFNMDEYVGLPRSHPESYFSFMHTNFFDHVDIPVANINMLDGNATDLQAECERYEQRIQAVGGVDLFLGGVGSDGHIAFNEPGSSLASVTRVKTLTHDTLLANSRFFDGNIRRVPTKALTVGVKTIMDAREVLVIATGTSKAIAVKKSVEEGINHMWTLSCLQMHQCSMIVVDEDATMELQVKTVRYFKSIESPLKNLGKTTLAPLQTTSPVLRPQTPLGKRPLDEDMELTPDSMCSRIAGFP